MPNFIKATTVGRLQKNSNVAIRILICLNMHHLMGMSMAVILWLQKKNTVPTFPSANHCVEV
jgi:hypothetical protein